MKRATVICFVMLWVLPLGLSAHADLAGYVQRPDDSFAFEVVETREIDEGTLLFSRMTSQTWQGIPWQHWVVILRPRVVTYPDNMVLVVGGGNVSDTPPSMTGGEARIIAAVAAQTRSAVALVTQVPNQPLFDGLVEDEIIALTYYKFLTGAGDDWPLLLPMAKSAVRAMDAVQQIMRERFEQEVKGFLLTGGSKRGWTSWLAAASGDSRVAAIAPAVIDMLNIVPQMQHQLACYNAYSDQIGDYTELGLQEMMTTPKGVALRALVDPYSYREKLTLPKMIVLGTNDPYWTVDAANFYFPGLVGEKHLIYQPNTEHDITLNAVSALAHFFLALQRRQSFPAITWERPAPNRLSVRWEAPGGAAHLWQAHSSNRDFRDALWTSSPLAGAGHVEAVLEPPASGWNAWYVEVRFPGELGIPFGNCSQIVVLPETLPFATASAE